MMRNLYIGRVFLGAMVTLMLMACDGMESNTPPKMPTTVSPTNSTPIAVLHAEQQVVVGESVALDGSSSSDADGDALTYNWVLISKPQESHAKLAQPNQTRSRFIADVVGSYEISLTVNDGFINSERIVVVVTARANESNAAETPETKHLILVADAGPTQNVRSNSLVTLNGNGSSVANKAKLAYFWTLISKPKRSAATLVDATSPKPTFTADLPGTYTASLIVKNDKLESTAATVNINVNAAPIANAGKAQKVIPNSLVTLNGSESTDGNNDPLTFHWTLTSKPATSTATLKNVTSTKPVFMADLVGTYTASLVVNDGVEDSLPATVTVESDVPVFAFSGNAEKSAITTYSVDRKTGMLTNIASTTTDARPISMIIHPSQKYLYVAYLDANSLAVFSINAANGKLTKVSSIPVEITEYTSTVKPVFLTGDNEGHFIYVASQVTNNSTGSFATTVSAFSIDQFTGKLTPVSSILPPINNWSIEIHPNGKTAYVPSYNKNNITTYAIDQSSGELDPVGIAKTGFAPSSVVVEPGGNFAYASNFKQNTISVFTVNKSVGTLPVGSLTNTGAIVSVDKGPVFLTIHQSGKFLYSANYDAGTISVFNIDQTTGSLTPVNTVAANGPTSLSVSTLTVDPTGKFLYSITPDSGISIFSINPVSGELAEVGRQLGRSGSRIVVTKILK